MGWVVEEKRRKKILNKTSEEFQAKPRILISLTLRYLKVIWNNVTNLAAYQFMSVM